MTFFLTVSKQLEKTNTPKRREGGKLLHKKNRTTKQEKTNKTPLVLSSAHCYTQCLIRKNSLSPTNPILSALFGGGREELYITLLLIFSQKRKKKKEKERTKINRASSAGVDEMSHLIKLAKALQTVSNAIR